MSVKNAGKTQIGRPFQPGNPGRPRGTKNKISRTAKENVEQVFDMLGGVEGMQHWASKNDHNRAIFYQSIYSKILPMDIHNEHSGKVDSTLTIEVVETK